MTTHPVFHNPEFDAYAADYDAALAQGLAVSGEDKMYFAHGRLAWLATCLRRLGEQPATVMDYGCGIGSATPAFFESLGVTAVVGTDISPRSLDVARHAYGSSAPAFSCSTTTTLMLHWTWSTAMASSIISHRKSALRLWPMWHAPYVLEVYGPSGKTTPGIQGRGMSCIAFPLIATPYRFPRRKHGDSCRRVASRFSGPIFCLFFLVC